MMKGMKRKQSHNVCCCHQNDEDAQMEKKQVIINGNESKPNGSDLG